MGRGTAHFGFCEKYCMNKTCFSRRGRVVLYTVISMLLLGALAVVGMQSIRRGQARPEDRQLTFSRDLEGTVNGNQTVFSKLPALLHVSKGTIVTLDIALPEDLQDGMCLTVKTVFSYLRIQYEGNLLYAAQQTDRFAPEKAIHQVPLTADMAGKQLVIQLEASDNWISVGKISIGRRSAVYQTLFQNNLLPLLGIVIGVFLSLASLIFGVIFCFRKDSQFCTVSRYGALLLTTSLWVCSRLDLIWFFFPWYAWWTAVSMVLLLLTAVILWSVLRPLSKIRIYFYHWVCLGILAAGFVSLLLQLLGLIPLYRGAVAEYLMILVMAVAELIAWMSGIARKINWKTLLPLGIGTAFFFAVLFGPLEFFLTDGFGEMEINVCLFFSFLLLCIGGMKAIRQVMHKVTVTDYLQELSLVDKLTGLNNRNAYELKLQELQEKGSGGANVGFVVIDVNHFKSLNDNFGHLVGDQTLSFVGQTVQRNFGDLGICYRIGGDEFCVIVCGHSALRVRGRIERLKAALLAASHHITVSCGYAELCGTSGITDADLLRSFNEADAEMYANKQ